LITTFADVPGAIVVVDAGGAAAASQPNSIDHAVAINNIDVAAEFIQNSARSWKGTLSACSPPKLTWTAARSVLVDMTRTAE